MSTFTQVVPGKVVNHGIVSGETFTTVTPTQTSPAHFPDFAAVTPKGPLNHRNITLSSFTRTYGDVSDHYGLYYNPITYAILKLKDAQQYSMGFRRLTNNAAKARTVWGVVLFEESDVPDYKRNSDGSIATDDDGKKIKEETAIKGLFVLSGYLTIEPKFFDDDTNATTNKVLPEIPVTVTTGSDDLAKDVKGTFYPFASFISGVGDHYNKMYSAVGHTSSIDWTVVEQFVKVNGVYPFQMLIGEKSDSGLNIDAATQSGATVSNFTLYETLDVDTNTPFSLKRGLGEYTGANINRPIEVSEQPYSDIDVYQKNIDTVCRLLYAAEYGEDRETPPVTQTNRAPQQAIMNPIDFKNEQGVPYRHIVYPEGVVAESNVQHASFVTKPFSLVNRMPASGALNPFLDVSGNYPEQPEDWDASRDGEWVVTPSITAQPTKKQLWYITQDLLEAHYSKYLTSKYFINDVIRDRTSHLWDLGYRKSITNLMLQATLSRKDFMAIGCATIYGGSNTTDSLYARSRTLHARAIQYPESEEYNAPATRISINLWDSYYIDEPTFDKFSLNIDLMCAYAAAGGSQDGRISKENLPDAGANAILRIAHTPSVDYEDDAPAAENLINGCITVRPCNMTQWKRPALPTVYNVTDSVLKDQVNVWYGIVIEKILQDQWILVSGQTMPASSYLATVKDNADKEIHSRMGSCLSSWNVATEFREDEPNARSTMYSKVTYWVGKARYMMDLVLEARNEEELGTDDTTTA